MTLISSNVLGDSILALGLGIAFYYGLTGYACVVYYRRELFKSVKNLLFIGLAPLLGAMILTALFIKSCFDLGKTDAGSTVIFGVGGPLVIGLGAILIGIPFMLLCRWKLPEFFTRKPEVADPALVEAAAARLGS